MKELSIRTPLTLRRARFRAGSLTKEERKKGPPVWVFRFQDGKKRRKQILGSTKELNKSQAQKCADEYRRAADNQQKPASELTVAELLEHFKARELAPDSGRAEKPRKAYLQIITNYLLPTWGRFSLSQVKAVAVEDWLKTLALANGSKAKLREVFGAAFRHAMRHELYAANPIANVRQARKRAQDPEILAPHEIGAVLRELEGIEPVRTAFLVAALMGMRRGEVFGLKWSDIDFGSANLHIRRSYVDGFEGPPKTDSSRRPLPIPGPVQEALSTWKSKSAHSGQDDWVFASEISFGKQPLWPGTLWRRNVVPALTRAAIHKPKLGWHTLRRSYASLLLTSGVSLRTAMELMRHSTAEMTLATYAQTIGSEKRDASSQVASMLVDAGSNFLTQN